jgi:hypothetical protein
MLRSVGLLTTTTTRVMAASPSLMMQPRQRLAPPLSRLRGGAIGNAAARPGPSVLSSGSSRMALHNTAHKGPPHMCWAMACLAVTGPVPEGGGGWEAEWAEGGVGWGGSSASLVVA